jgi:hypothetical protein
MIFFVCQTAKRVVLAQQGGPERRNGRLDAAAIPQTEDGSVSGATPSV